MAAKKSSASSANKSAGKSTSASKAKPKANAKPASGPTSGQRKAASKAKGDSAPADDEVTAPSTDEAEAEVAETRTAADDEVKLAPLAPVAHGDAHVAIVGRTPAGLIAAIDCARHGLTVELTPGSNDADEVGLLSDLVWTGAKGKAALEGLKLAKPIAWKDADAMHFINADGSEHAQLEKPPAVHLASLSDLMESLEETAKAAHVRIQRRTMTGIALHDRRVTVDRSGQTTDAGLLIFADAAVGKPVLSAARLRTPLQLQPPNWSIYPLVGGSKRAKTTLTVVIGWQGGRHLGSLWTDGETGVLALPEKDVAPKDRVETLLAAMRKKKIIPEGLGFTVRKPQRRRYLPAASLEFDQHFGKRSLLVGGAGGFSSALSGETLFVSVKVAQLVGDVCNRALRSAHPQDMLGTFDTQWRMTLADFLRLPNTDLQFILPVVFSNEQIADKIAAGFVDGENL